MCYGMIGCKMPRKIYIYNETAKSNNEIIRICSYVENMIVVCDDFVKSEIVETVSKRNKIILKNEEQIKKTKIYQDKGGRYCEV